MNVSGYRSVNAKWRMLLKFNDIGGLNLIHHHQQVDPGGSVVIIFATGFEVRGFKPGRGRWIFSERKNPEYDFLRKGSKAVGAVS